MHQLRPLAAPPPPTQRSTEHNDAFYPAALVNPLAPQPRSDAGAARHQTASIRRRSGIDGLRSHGTLEHPFPQSREAEVGIAPDLLLVTEPTRHAPGAGLDLTAKEAAAAVAELKH